MFNYGIYVFDHVITILITTLVISSNFSTTRCNLLYLQYLLRICKQNYIGNNEYVVNMINAILKNDTCQTLSG